MQKNISNLNDKIMRNSKDHKVQMGYSSFNDRQDKSKYQNEKKKSDMCTVGFKTNYS